MMTHLWMGKRILKTGAAVFITAQICHWLGWPSIFAVIAAIVTIEPSIEMSIKKGAIRLPSAVIGAAFAMIFGALFGNQPLTYMLSALTTIYVIQLLKWNDALIVATLTSVNMISLADVHFLDSFLVRVGTTTTGIVVSAFINYLIFPPKYTKNINSALPNLVKQTFHLSNQIIGYSLRCSNQDSAAILSIQLNKFKEKLSRTLQLCSWQIADYRYKTPPQAELKEILTAKRTIKKLQLICSYLEVTLQSPPVSFSIKEEELGKLWEQWLHFDNTNQPIELPLSLKTSNEHKTRLIVSSLVCHMEYIQVLLRQLPSAYVDNHFTKKDTP